MRPHLLLHRCFLKLVILGFCPLESLGHDPSSAIFLLGTKLRQLFSLALALLLDSRTVCPHLCLKHGVVETPGVWWEL
ncbi:hypothetical protein I79_009245 [Cricetulus griseus]|uniref:Secreted protein n=1 Tax=Cricetulus griseus TaxID=10029 RepID=G3HF89_CRIGR|nr:hypothetical protein I79_009245 [Cricetulus griseus]